MKLSRLKSLHVALIPALLGSIFLVACYPAAGQEKTWDFQFPHEVGVMGAGTYGKDISGWYQLTFAPVDGEVSVERCFAQFSNLFAWDEDADEDGSHLGNRFLVLPKYAFNIKLGKMNTSVIPQVASEHSRLPIFEPIPNLQTIGLTGFSLESTQLAIEANGIIKQNWSYAVGIANGGSAAGAPADDNTFKDIYFRVARVWFGFPFDGVVGAPAQTKTAAAQNSDDEESEDEMEPPGLDFWRAVRLETGIFGWKGRSLVPPVSGFSTDVQKENFERIGGDFRFQCFDWNIFGLGYWGHDQFAGLLDDGTDLGAESHFSYFVEADYFFKPWLLGLVRYEQTKFHNETRGALQDQARVVPGLIFLIRQNVKLQFDLYINTQPNSGVTDAPQATNQFITQLDMAF
jgi:hypothetical protein